MEQAVKERRGLGAKRLDTDNPPPSWDDESRGTTGWITRNQAADLVGCSPQTLILWEAKKRIEAKLAYRPRADGAWVEQVVYHPDQIRALPRRSLRPVAKDPDELAARVTELLEQGMSDRDIVMELRVDYSKVVRLRDLWMEGGGATRVLTREQADGFAEIFGPFDTLAELLALARGNLATQEPAQEKIP